MDYDKLKELCKMNEELKNKPYIESYEHRFIFAAKKVMQNEEWY